MSRFLHSTSANKYYEACPAQFWLYQTGAPRGKSPLRFRFGNTAHVALELYVNHCIAAGRRTDITVIGDVIDQAVRQTGMNLQYYEELAGVVRGFLAVYEIDVEHSIAREGGIAFDDDLNLVDWDEAIEYDRMTNPAAQKGPIFFRCKLDHSLLYLNEQTLVVQDYKSDLFAPSKTAIAEPSSRFRQQAEKYAWAAWRALFPAEFVRVEFLFLRYVAHGRVLTRSLTFAKADILAIQEAMLARAGFIEATKEFPATPGDHCESCAFRETACPVRNQLELTDPGSVMRSFLYERVQQEDRRERLKEYVAEHGYDGEMGLLRAVFEQDEKQLPDMRRVWQFFLDAGVENPWALLNLSNTAAKSILDKESFAELIRKAYDPDIAVKFNVHQRRDALVTLCEERGIETRKEGKTAMKDRTVAELAWDLAQVADQPGAGEEAMLEVDLSSVETAPPVKPFYPWLQAGGGQ